MRRPWIHPTITLVTRDELLAEADRLIEEARERAAAKVRERLGPSPREREAMSVRHADPDYSAPSPSP